MNLKILVSVIGLVPQLLQIVDSAVVSVENSLQALPGADKFEAALAKVDSILSTAIEDSAILDNLRTVAGPLINAAVAAFNAAKVFTHSSADTADAGNTSALPPAQAAA